MTSCPSPISSVQCYLVYLGCWILDLQACETQLRSSLERCKSLLNIWAQKPKKRPSLPLQLWLSACYGYGSCTAVAQQLHSPCLIAVPAYFSSSHWGIDMPCSKISKIHWIFIGYAGFVKKKLQPAGSHEEKNQKQLMCLFMSCCADLVSPSHCAHLYSSLQFPFESYLCRISMNFHVPTLRQRLKVLDESPRLGGTVLMLPCKWSNAQLIHWLSLQNGRSQALSLVASCLKILRSVILQHL